MTDDQDNNPGDTEDGLTDNKCDLRVASISVWGNNNESFQKTTNVRSSGNSGCPCLRCNAGIRGIPGRSCGDGTAP